MYRQRWWDHTCKWYSHLFRWDHRPLSTPLAAALRVQLIGNTLHKRERCHTLIIVKFMEILTKYYVDLRLHIFDSHFLSKVAWTWSVLSFQIGRHSDIGHWPYVRHWPTFSRCQWCIVTNFVLYRHPLSKILSSLSRNWQNLRCLSSLCSLLLSIVGVKVLIIAHAIKEIKTKRYVEVSMCQCGSVRNKELYFNIVLLRCNTRCPFHVSCLVERCKWCFIHSSVDNDEHKSFERKRISSFTSKLIVSLYVFCINLPWIHVYK